MNKASPTIEAFVFPSALLDGTEEHNLGLRELQFRLPEVRAWHRVDTTTQSIAESAHLLDADYCLVLIDSAVLISNNLVSELASALDDNALYAMPADYRAPYPDIAPDYYSRAGFDRYVDRLSLASRLSPYDGRAPWLLLTRSSTITKLLIEKPTIDWEILADTLDQDTVITNRAFIHSYADYHLNNRQEMLALVPDSTRELLDIGGGAGAFASYFAANRSGNANILEMNSTAAKTAEQKGLTVYQGDLFTVELNKKFDCVSLLDVLEHLEDPHAALVRAGELLQPGGTLVLSVPNVGHWSVVWDLITGRFNYQPVGILCNTHLRFFTKESLETLLKQTGYEIVTWQCTHSPAPQEFIEFIQARSTDKIEVDMESLLSDSFHIAARRAR